MHYLITGGGGFLGTVLIRRILRHDNARITVLDRFDHGTQPLFSVIDGNQSSRVQVISGDVASKAVCERAWEHADACIHLAGIVGAPACDRDVEDAWSTNATGTANIVLTAEQRRIVLASTGSVYGKVDGIATEDTATNPLSIYGKTKMMAESSVLGADGVCLRFATLFGLSPRMRWDLLPHDFTRQLVQDGHLSIYQPNAWRTFLHVEDAAKALHEALWWNTGVYNVGYENGNITKRTLAEYIQSLVGTGMILNGGGTDPDQRDYQVSYAKVREKTSWRPERSIDNGLLDVVEAARVWR